MTIKALINFEERKVVVFCPKHKDIAC